jgi:integrase
MARRKKVPSYRLHKPSGQAVVTIAGRDRYLGPHDSPESHALYDRLIAEWLDAGRPSSSSAGPTVADLVADYLKHAEGWYQKAGKATSQLERIRNALARVTAIASALPAAKFGPRLLKQIREEMIASGWSRVYINGCIGCVKRAFRWAVSEELIPAAVGEALRAVEGLRAGRCKAKETQRVKPVPDAAIKPVLDQCLPIVRDMAHLQLLAGMRPGEVVQLRPADVDRTAEVWIYRPASHKTEHHGSNRHVFLGPRAQAILEKYLAGRCPDACCFSPREALEARRAERGQALTFSERRPPRDHYTSGSYARAIREACDRAGISRWHPHQLRHNAATAVRSGFGPDVARAFLGHESLQATKIYAELDLGAAAAAAAKLG